jgi:uncharacterized protein YegP (UPF0339 family)
MLKGFGSNGGLPMYFDIRKNPQAPGHQYWWVARGDNGETLCASEMLSSKQACISTIKVIKSGAADANVYDETGEVQGTVEQRRLKI